MMRSLPLLAALALVLGLSWLGTVQAPWLQLEGLAPHGDYPAAPSPAAARGRQLYIANNCAACHTQELGPADFPAAEARGWGKRRTVPRDLLLDAPPLPGAQRIGPDLSNVGARHPAAAWYEALLAVPGAGMPSYSFLFANGAPTPEGRDLIAYLLSLDRSAPLPEAAP